MTIYLISLILTQKQFPHSFSSLLTLLLSLLYKTPVAVRFPAKITLSCIWDVKLIELFHIGMPVVRTDGLLGGRSVYGHVITKFSRMGRLLQFLTHGAPLACFARESSAIIKLELASAPDQRKQIDLVIMYFCKAFDKIPHQCLLLKLQQTGLEGSILLLLLSLLSQSLLVFFLCISRAQTMHLERQSLKSIILFIH